MNRILKITSFVAISLIMSTACANSNASANKNEETENVVKAAANPSAETEKAKIVHLTNDSFKKLVFDYENNKEWKYEGTTPCIIDFYADWCGPCKRIAPILEELAQEYHGEVIIYKVNTEEQRELAGAFGIQSIPAILFVPASGQPQMAQGALPKESFEKAINEVLKVKK